MYELGRLRRRREFIACLKSPQFEQLEIAVRRWLGSQTSMS
jgi:hypothetical protein